MPGDADGESYIVSKVDWYIAWGYEGGLSLEMAGS